MARYDEYAREMEGHGDNVAASVYGGASTPEIWHDGAIESVRLDIWLWAVRLTPTRSVATDLCRTGRVFLNGSAAKAASAVKVGDRIEARIAQRQRILEVTQVISKRVGAPKAADCLVDHSPAVEPADPSMFVRDRGTGRPTKRDRRQIEQLRRPI